MRSTPGILRDARRRPCVSLAEAARRLGITREAVRQAVRDGRLDSVTVAVPVVAVPVEALRRYQVTTPQERGRRRWAGRMARIPRQSPKNRA